jgi:FMN phosphatase YigB (HAD superfamily)
MLTKNSFIPAGDRSESQSRLAKVKALLVDIDETIIRAKRSASDGPNPFNAASLLEVLRQAGMTMTGLSPQETDRRIRRVQSETRWWHWSDFILELELEPAAFWAFAYATEQRYLEPTGPEIGAALQRIRDAGVLLYVTSNNASSGILHKLRLAGIGDFHSCRPFDQLLGATELQAMKWESLYWRKVLAHIGLAPHEVAVVGDELQCDWLVPHSVGIGCGFQINRDEDLSAGDGGGLYHVQNFNQIADKLLTARDGAPAGQHRSEDVKPARKIM